MANALHLSTELFPSRAKDFCLAYAHMPQLLQNRAIASLPLLSGFEAESPPLTSLTNAIKDKMSQIPETTFWIGAIDNLTRPQGALSVPPSQYKSELRTSIALEMMFKFNHDRSSSWAIVTLAHHTGSADDEDNKEDEEDDENVVHVVHQQQAVGGEPASKKSKIGRTSRAAAARSRASRIPFTEAAKEAAIQRAIEVPGLCRKGSYTTVTSLESHIQGQLENSFDWPRFAGVDDRAIKREILQTHASVLQNTSHYHNAYGVEDNSVLSVDIWSPMPAKT
ncbi:hypothetical protein BKA63DRAFT_488264 [Paraphoma chrysanthemicola]|nr:hypothetical protein BKA63DRAFT_488264 [Paraphoma chrysanthemicola]